MNRRAWLLVALCAACAGTQVEALVQCKLDALRILPRDPKQATVYDAADLIARLNACHRQGEDGGAP